MCVNQACHSSLSHLLVSIGANKDYCNMNFALKIQVKSQNPVDFSLLFNSPYPENMFLDLGKITCFYFDYALVLQEGPS